MRETGPRVQNRSTTEALSQGVNQLLVDCLYAGRVRQKRIIQFAADVGKMATAPSLALMQSRYPRYHSLAPWTQLASVTSFANKPFMAAIKRSLEGLE